MSGDLGRYRAKRKAGDTPEPFGRDAVRRPGLFVVQEHRARRHHYDFRLEWRGVLLSWAVPKKPSYDPTVKRLAVAVEDHPVDYADFEGMIPAGNYGAGAVIVWDRGRWVPAEDAERGLAKGHLVFDLHGYKLRGRWNLVRIHGRSKDDRGKEWLLVKQKDGYADGDREAADASIFSGLTLEERAGGSPRIDGLRERALQVGRRSRRIDPKAVRPMLAAPREQPFSRPGWIFEVKYDGYRVIADRETILSRNGLDLTAAFPEIAAALAVLPLDACVLDGEIVVLAERGHPSFAHLQKRARLSRVADVGRASVETPATLFAFDLLAVDDVDLRGAPLVERKALLRDLLPPLGPLRYVPHFAERGEDVYEEVSRLGLEGIVAKKADAPYRAGRSDLWQKVRALRTDDLVVVGFTAPRGSRSGFGALDLAAWDGDRLRYAGRVGSGFGEADMMSVRDELDGLLRKTPAVDDPPRGAGSRWVEPRLVCEVRYREVTPDGRLRQPVFLRMRDDKDPRECVWPGRMAGDVPPAAGETPSAQRAVEAPVEKILSLSNLDKVFWPKERITKGDLLEYYRKISPWILPYLRDRPVVLTRYPDGIEGKSFYQKDAPEWVPSWIRTERMWSEHAEREIQYFVCDDLESLLYVVNLGAIPLHVWMSRASSLAHPDWCLLDLDPKGAPFANVVRVARKIREITEAIELPSFVKTSGQAGVHVLIPLGRQLTYEQSRALAGLLGRIVTDELPEIATMTRPIAARKGKVYVDTLQNRHGQLVVAPFSVRPIAGAPVSTPLRWSEVTGRLDPARHTLRSVPSRIRRLKKDPVAPVLTETPDLLAALARLRDRLER